MLTYLLRGITLGLTASAAPGPFQAYTINQTLTFGWRKAVPLAFVPLISDIPIIIVMVFLLDKLPENLIPAISITGGLFVLYIAWGYWRRWRENRTNEVSRERDLSNGGFRKGVLMNLLSPGPYSFWALVNGPILLSAFRISLIYGISFLFGFYGLMIAGILLIIIIFHQTRRFGPKVLSGLLLVSTVILVILGVVLIVDGIRNIVI